MTAASMGFSVYGPTLLQTLYRLSATAAGYVVAIEALAWTAAGLSVTHLKGPWPSRLIVAGAASAALGIGLSAPAFTLGGVPAVLAAGAFLGAGFGLFWSFMAQRVLTSLSAEERAIGAAANTTVQLTGSAAGAALAGVVANLSGLKAGLTEASARSAGFWVFVVALPVALLGVWTARRLAAASPDAPPPR
jgi:hypothetical protein